MPVKLRCPVCGNITFVPDLRALLSEIEKQWQVWLPYMSLDQRDQVKNTNNPDRLARILQEDGELTMFCAACQLRATLGLLSSQTSGRGPG